MDRLSNGSRLIFVSGIVLSTLLLTFSYAYTWYAVDDPWWIWTSLTLFTVMFGIAVYTVIRIHTGQTSLLAGGALVTSLLGFVLIVITGAVSCFVSGGAGGAGSLPEPTLAGRRVGIYAGGFFFSAIGIEPPRSSCTIHVNLFGTMIAHGFLAVSLWYDRGVDVIVFRFTELLDRFLALRQ